MTDEDPNKIFLECAGCKKTKLLDKRFFYRVFISLEAYKNACNSKPPTPNEYKDYCWDCSPYRQNNVNKDK